MGEHFDTLEFLVDRVKPDDPNNNYNSGPTLEPDGKTTAHKAVAMLSN
jgi:hypothetical protein